MQVNLEDFSEEEIKRLEAICLITGRSRAELVRYALRRFLNEAAIGILKDKS